MKSISVTVTIASTLEKVWSLFTSPPHIMKWNHASPDWQCPHAESDLRVGGQFIYTMSATDGSATFDFIGTFTEVNPVGLLAYTILDGRRVTVLFDKTRDGIKVTEKFDAESTHSEEAQRAG